MKKKIPLAVLIVWMACFFCGCRIIRIEEEERKPLEYEVVSQDNAPAGLLTLVEERKTKEFQMTYQAGKELYLVRGYGRQMTGGCSVAVEEVSRSSNGIFFKTKLLGPSEGEQGGEPSYPFIIVKIGYRKAPVQFL